jgi:hypothetical protein
VGNNAPAGHELTGSTGPDADHVVDRTGDYTGVRMEKPSPFTAAKGEGEGRNVSSEE